MSPRVLHERLGDLGFSYAVLYPTSGMGSAGVQDDEVRIGLCRGFNDFFANVYGPFQDRVTVAGIIPMNTVDEAIAELEHCKQIGLKVVGIPERRVAIRSRHPSRRRGCCRGRRIGGTSSVSTANTTTTRCGPSSKS